MTTTLDHRSRVVEAPVRVRPPELWRVEGGTIHIAPHWGQRRALTSPRRFVWMLAGTQSGKTALGPLWLEQEMAMRGPGDYLAVTSTIPLLRLKMLPEFLRYFNRLSMGRWAGGEKVYYVERAGHPAKDSRVIFGSATNPESLESATAKAAWLDECGQDMFRLGSWEAVQRRLGLNEGRVLGTTTPYNLGWLKQQVYDRWAAGDTAHDVIQFETIENPVYPAEEFERMRRALPAWKFDLFYRAQFARPAGLIYSDFVDAYREEGGHKVRPFAVPPEWPRYVGLDFGGVNTAAVWLAEDPSDKTLYLYHETLTGGLTVAQHVAALKRYASETGGRIRRSWGGAKSEDQWRRDFTASGLPVELPPVWEVEAGIDRVTALFKEYRLLVFDTCAGVLDELGTYQRETDEDSGEPTEKIRDKETFHRLDALRYLAAGLSMATPPVAPDSLTRSSIWSALSQANV